MKETRKVKNLHRYCRHNNLNRTKKSNVRGKQFSCGQKKIVCSKISQRSNRNKNGNKNSGDKNTINQRSIKH